MPPAPPAATATDEPAPIAPAPTVAPAPSPRAFEDPKSGEPGLAAPTEEPAPLVRTFRVAEGDTLAAVTARNALRGELLLWANSLADPVLLQPGRVLRLPALEGLLYTPGRGLHGARMAPGGAGRAAVGPGSWLGRDRLGREPSAFPGLMVGYVVVFGV